MIKTAPALTTAAEARATRLSFFRQSGWMLVATTLGGVLMYAVHRVAKEMPKPEYGVFMTLLQVLNMMTIPAMGLQLVFVQQTVAAFARGERRQLTGTVRSVLGVAFTIWICLVLLTWFFQDRIAAAYKIENPAALWATVAMALIAAINPVVMGLLQGKMNFLWLGISAMLNGAGRLIAIALIVLVWGGYAAGAMSGAVLGMCLAVGVAAWHTRDIWWGPSEPMQWRPWLARVIPLTLGFGTATVMLSWDMIVVQRFFPAELTGFYAAAGMIGRALVFLTAPLTAVMFPKVVQSAARAEKSNVMIQALGATALLGGMAALGCTLVPWLPLSIIYDKSFLSVAPLVPWFAWCMLPLTTANVLLNNLLAHRRFEVVPWLMAVAAGYAATLWFFHDSFLRVVQLLGVFSLLFFGVCFLFTWRQPAAAAAVKEVDGEADGQPNAKSNPS